VGHDGKRQKEEIEGKNCRLQEEGQKQLKEISQKFIAEYCSGITIF